jgi:uncharacterized membrane protein YraQ (UPF0718 family)
LKKHSVSLGLLVLMAAVHFALFIVRPDKAREVMSTAGNYFLEMISILPPILVLVGLFDAWVPRRVIEAAMGKGSGIKGAFFAILAGTAGMGPLYAGFPLAKSLLGKGASLTNMTIFICAWASIKIPMILFEVKFLGAEFALLRLALTIPAILLISGLMKLVEARSVSHESN